MINNNFNLIGTVTSDFTDVAAAVNFPKKEFTIEVEKKGGKGYSTTMKCVVLGNNQSIKTDIDLTGKTVIVSGYIDCYKNFVSLVAQDMFVVGQAREKLVYKTKEPTRFDSIQDEPLPWEKEDDGEDRLF